MRIHGRLKNLVCNNATYHSKRDWLERFFGFVWTIFYLLYVKHEIHVFVSRLGIKELHKEAEIPEATQCVHETQGVLPPNLETNPVLRWSM